MHKVAIIGPLGSGKSEIVRICAEFEFPTVSADHIARMLLDLPGIAHDDVVKAFPSVVDPSGRINRHALAEDVFHNHEHLELLEGIIHPHVWQIVTSFFMECENKKEEICFVEVSAPDSSIRTRFDEMWCVTAPHSVRENRCVERGMSMEDFEIRNQFQETHVDYADLATRTIVNEGSVSDLTKIIRGICDELAEVRGN